MSTEDKRLIWEEHFPVFSFLCGKNKEIQLTSLAQFFQEMAWRHAEYCGAGYKGLMSKGLIWILSGLRIKVINYPVWEDQLHILTWGKEYVNLFAFREFEILDKDNKSMVTGISSWIVADAKTHRPVRITEDLQKIPPVNRHVEVGKPGKIQAQEKYTSFFDVHVPASAIDVYNHVNNTKYIEWCMDAVPEIHNENMKIRDFDIRFIQETKFNEKIRILFSIWKDEILYKGVNLSSGKEVFRAKALI